MDAMIDVTGADLRELVRAVFDLSEGDQEEKLSDAEVDQALGPMLVNSAGIVLALDTLRDRRVHFTLCRTPDGSLCTPAQWLGHSDFQLRRALMRAGVRHEL